MNDMFEGFPEIFGINLAPVVIGIAIIIAVYIMLKDPVSRYLNKRKKDNESQDKDKLKTEPIPKSKRSWSFNPFGWLKTTDKKKLWDKILIWIIVPGILIVGGLLVYAGKISFSGGEIIWLIIIGLALIIFATRSRWFRLLTMWVGSGILVGLMIYGLTTMNLMGTPWPVKTQEANLMVEYDVSNPRWTAISIVIPDDCILDISADGMYYWDSLDSRGPCDPNGMRDPRNGLWVPTRDMLGSNQFLAGLLNQTFACLIGRVGEDGEPFAIGKHCVKQIKKGGILYLGINIRWIRTGGMRGYTGPDSWKKNWMNATGTVDVDISIMSQSEWEKKEETDMKKETTGSHS